MSLIGLFAVGTGWIIAALQVYLRDAAQVMAVVLTLGSGSRRSSSPNAVSLLGALSSSTAQLPWPDVVRATGERLLSFNLLHEAGDSGWPTRQALPDWRHVFRHLSGSLDEACRDGIGPTSLGISQEER